MGRSKAPSLREWRAVEEPAGLMKASAEGRDGREALMQVVATTGLMEAFVTDVIAVRPTTEPNVCCLGAASAGGRHPCPDSSGLQIASVPGGYHAIERRETIKVQMIESTQAAATSKRRKMIRFVFPFTRMKSESRFWLHRATSIGPLQFCVCVTVVIFCLQRHSKSWQPNPKKRRSLPEAKVRRRTPRHARQTDLTFR